MRHLVILGAGTAGTMVANKMRAALPPTHWRVTVVEPDPYHRYQPGYLFVPFGKLAPADLVRPVAGLLARGVDLVTKTVERVSPEDHVVHLTDGTEIGYTYLVIATGTTPRPDQVPGMADDLGGAVHEFYTLPGATALGAALAQFAGGRLVVHVSEMPIKCPVAPLEMAFLVEAHLKERGLRDRTEVTYVTPLPGAFTRPVASERLGHLLEERDIAVEPDFVVERIDPEERLLCSFDGREIPYDLLVTVPVNMGADFVTASGLGDELGYVPVDPHTLLADGQDSIFAIGDATNAPASKAGSVAHFQADVFVENFIAHAQGRPMPHRFDGHANCFVELGHGKGLLLDFNYDTQPLTGTYPLPVVGPMRLLSPSRVNHWGKLAFRWIYWHMLLPGRRIPVPTAMHMAGKRRPPEPVPAAAPDATFATPFD